MQTYHTAEVAKIIGIHPNTVRLYEQLKLIPTPERQQNGYRIYTELHIAQFKLARTALQVEVLQNGLRKRAVEIIKVSAQGDWSEAKLLTERYLQAIQQEQKNAEAAIQNVQEIWAGREQSDDGFLKRRETADYLQISMDTLRNWEMNGLLTIKRKQNGYRVYTSSDIKRLKIIRALRCANYSLAAILRMLGALAHDPHMDLREAIDTPSEQDEIIAVCDKLLTSLSHAEQNARRMYSQLENMEQKF